MKFPSLLRRRFLLPAVGGLALIGLGTAAVAKPGGPPGAEGQRRGGICAKLSCTDDQREQIREVMKELRADAKGDREAIKRLHGQMAAEFAKDQPDEAALRAAQAQAAVHEKELRDRGFDALMEVHALLDAEQRASLAKAMKHRGLRGLMGPGRRGKHKGKRGKKGEEGKRAAG